MKTDIRLEKYSALAELVTMAKQVKRENQKISGLSESVSRFALSQEVVGVLNDTIRLFLEDPMASPSLMQQDNVVLHDEPLGILIAIGKTSFSEYSSIYSAPSDTLLAPLTTRGFKYARYEVDDEFDPEVFSRKVRVRLDSEACCQLGDVVQFASGKVNEYARMGDCVLKVYDRRASVGLMWEFERSTGEAVGAYAADVESTTLRYLLKFLATYPDHVDSESVKLLLDHPYHFVRWEALKTLAAVSPEDAQSALVRLLSDPHPHIRYAAAKTNSQEARA